MNNKQHTAPFLLAQLSDLHLTGEIGHHASYQSFLQVLQLAVHDGAKFLLLTGDLVNDGDKNAYTWLIDTMNATRLPYALLAGNHDVSLELGKDLPYAARRLMPITKDNRLIGQQRFTLGAWQLLCINSAVAGHEHGHIDEQTLAWLDTILAQHPKATLIALHHHPMAVGSAWIDKLQLNNADELLCVLAKHSHAKALLSGHVHQACQIRQSLGTHDITLYTCPATSRQFAPFAKDFALDNLPAGYRLIQLYNTGGLSTYIKRLIM
ncbi:MAG: metallophosphoesterase [Moraxella sp.]|nr:metallophosphoesterase [Moraxella sp.]